MCAAAALACAWGERRAQPGQPDAEAVAERAAAPPEGVTTPSPDARAAAAPAPRPAEPAAASAPATAPTPEPDAGARAAETGPPTSAAAETTLDLAALEHRLRATRALGPFTKLALKNDIDDLVAQMRDFHTQGRGDLRRLRERFELLLMKLLSLLQDRERDLADEIARSRDALWALLVDPRAFARLSEKS